jgi:hypothetical protein
MYELFYFINELVALARSSHYHPDAIADVLKVWSTELGWRIQAPTSHDEKEVRSWIDSGHTEGALDAYMYAMDRLFGTGSAEHHRKDHMRQRVSDIFPAFSTNGRSDLQLTNNCIESFHNNLKHNILT